MRSARAALVSPMRGRSSKTSTAPRTSPRTPATPVAGVDLGRGDLHERGLAGAVGPEDDPALVLLDGPVDVVEQGRLAASHGHAGELQNRVHRSLNPRLRHPESEGAGGRPQPTARASPGTGATHGTSRLVARGRRAGPHAAPTGPARSTRAPAAAPRGPADATPCGSRCGSTPGLRGAASLDEARDAHRRGRRGPRRRRPARAGRDGAADPGARPAAGRARHRGRAGAAEPGRPGRPGRARRRSTPRRSRRRGGRARAAPTSGWCRCAPAPGVVWRCLPAPRAASGPDLGRGRHRRCAPRCPAVADALADLEVARWRPEVADELMALRRDDRPRCCRRGTDPRAARMVALAARCRRIVDLALAGRRRRGDRGGGRPAGARRCVPLDRAARRALVAALQPAVG